MGKKKIIEVWNVIQGYEGLYEVSNLGRVKSLERIIRQKNRFGVEIIKNLKERILVPRGCSGGHLQVGLWKNGVAKNKKIHKLVAEAFIPNPNNYNVVHHKDHNPTNNCVENLEWMSNEEHNVLHAKERGKKQSKRVDQIDQLTGEIIRQWNSRADIERELGYDHSLIGNCCNSGFYKKSRGKWVNAIQAYGYVWKYVID